MAQLPETMKKFWQNFLKSDIIKSMHPLPKHWALCFIEIPMH